MTEPKRQTDIELLSPNFKAKFKERWSEIIKLYPNAMVFETLRSKERQVRLYGIWRTHSMDRKPVTRTINSKHITGDAVDIVFKDSKGNPTRNWPYDQLIVIAKRYGIKNLKPKETCHFEDDGTLYKKQYNMEEKEGIRKCLEANGWMRNFTNDSDLKNKLHLCNDRIRDLYM